MKTSTANSPFPLFSIAVLSATALSYEILLTRLFAIIQYHHFAYMIISLALLGYGISGTLLSLFRDTVTRLYRPFFLGNIALFSVSTLACFLLAQKLAFNAELMLWDYSQSLRLFMTYLFLMLPFFFAANAIGLSLMMYGRHIGKIYAADLLGAGVGSICIVGLLFMLPPEKVLPVLATAGLLSALLACWELKAFHLKTVSAFVGMIIVVLILPGQWLALELSPYKGLPQLLRVQDTKIITSKSSPLGVIHVVESPGLPLRYAPGLSLNATTEPPPQLAVFTDGDGMTAINAAVKDNAQLSFLDQQTSAAAYHLVKPAQVLVLGAGTGNDILQARYHQAGTIDAVELNPQITQLMTEEYASYSGNLFKQTGINLHIQDARGFISNTGKQFDLIQTSLLDSHGASSAGLYALNENYLYTVEAIKQYLEHLKPDGYLSITRWIKLPPRDSLKIFATVIEALRDAGISNPGKQLVLIRSWQTSTLLVKNGIVSERDIGKLLVFCNDRLFDTAYYPGINIAQTNIYNILREPYFYQGATALLGNNAHTYLQQYKFDLTPATDDQPYFSNFFKWKLLPEIMSLKESGGMPLMEWGYIILIATLLQAMLTSAVLILLPLFAGKTRRINTQSTAALSLVYFTALGLGFLFIEIAFMQKFTLFLHHPLYSISVTLAASLVFAGWGSNMSKQWQMKWDFAKSIKLAVTGIVICGALYLLMLDSIFVAAMGIPTFLKIIIAGLLIAPLAFCMGIPFPLALSYLNEKHPQLIPWAWGVNGCASVISAVLAMLLAIHAGFTAVIICALGLYLCAWLVFSTIIRKGIDNNPGRNTANH